MSAVAMTPSEDEMKRAIIDFVRGASIEISPDNESLLPALAEALPTGTTLYVAHTPRASLSDVVSIAIKAQALGFRASPHLVARRLEGERPLNAALQELRDAGVEQLLLIAGDLPHPI